MAKKKRTRPRSCRYLDEQDHMVATCCSRYTSTSGKELYKVKLEFTK